MIIKFRPGMCAVKGARGRLCLSSATMSSLVAGFKRPLVLGIRREDPARIWERRSPLVPAHVRRLLEKHKDLKVQVQRCTRRFFTEEQYTEVRRPPLSHDQRLSHVYRLARKSWTISRRRMSSSE